MLHSFSLLVAACALAQPPADAPKTTRLTLPPAAAPVPALRYHLLPEMREVKTGNAALYYNRSMASEWSTHRDKKIGEAIQEWYDNPTKLPGKNLEFVLTYGMLREIEHAAKCSHCEWGLLERLREEGVGMLLPDVQGFRTTGHLLAVRARLQIERGELDKALLSIRTGLKLGRDLAEGPTLIHGLVGAAITMQLLQQVEVLLQQPKAPNLYWALQDLPRPFIDMRRGFQSERIMIDQLFPGVRDMLAEPARVKPLSQAQVDEMFAHWRQVQSMMGVRSAALFGVNLDQPWVQQLGANLLAVPVYPQARQFLSERGVPTSKLGEIPVLQAVLLFEIHNFDRLYDESHKWATFPYPQARQGLFAADRQIKDAKAKGPFNGCMIATTLLPALFNVHTATARVQRKLAMLQCVETLRLHAAANKGALPQTLDDIKLVPVPRDPMTETPFLYQLKDGVATLAVPRFKDATPTELAPHYSWRYEIAIAK